MQNNIYTEHNMEKVHCFQSGVCAGKRAQSKMPTIVDKSHMNGFVGVSQCRLP